MEVAVDFGHQAIHLLTHEVHFCEAEDACDFVVAVGHEAEGVVVPGGRDDADVAVFAVLLAVVVVELVVDLEGLLDIVGLLEDPLGLALVVDDVP